MEVTIRKTEEGYIADNGEEKVILDEVCPKLEAMFEGESQEEEIKEDKTESRIKRMAEELEGKPKAPKYVDMGEEEEDDEMPKKKGFFGRIKR
jgi:hypothetical protein